MIFIYDYNEKQVDALDIDYVFTQELKKINTLEFECNKDIPNQYRIVLEENDKFYEFIIKEVDYERTETYKFKYYCEDSITELQHYLIEEKRPTNTFPNLLNLVLTNTRWIVDNRGGFDTSISKKMNFYRTTALTALLDIANLFRFEWFTEFVVSENKISQRKIVIEPIGNRANSRLEFGKNVQKFTRTIVEPIFTALVGLGKGEEKFDENNEATGGFGRKITFKDVNNGIWYIANEKARELYGINVNGKKEHLFGIVDFPEIEDTRELLELTKLELEKFSKPQPQYEIDVTNLFIDCYIGDTVGAIDEVINFRDYLRVTKVEKTKYSTTLLFGALISSFTKAKSKEIRQLESKVVDSVSTAIDYVFENINLDLNNKDAYKYDLKSGNEYGLTPGTYWFNKPIDQNPTEVMLATAGTLLIANEKDTDGRWKWKSAITPQGIVGSSIITNSITANQLSSDLQQTLELISDTAINQRVNNSVISKLSEKEIIDRFKGQDGNPGRDGESATFTWNLLKNTKDIEFNSTNGREYVGTTFNLTPIFDEYGLQEYTISFDIKTLSTKTNQRIQVYTQNSGQQKYDLIEHVNVTNEFTRQQVVVTPKPKHPNTNNWSTLAFYGIYDTGNVPVIKNVKVSLGNNPNDTWTPHVDEINGKNGTDGQDFKWNLAKGTVDFNDKHWQKHTSDGVELIEFDSELVQKISLPLSRSLNTYLYKEQIPLKKNTLYTVSIEIYPVDTEFDIRTNIPNHFHIRRNGKNESGLYNFMTSDNRMIEPNRWHRVFYTIRTNDFDNLSLIPMGYFSHTIYTKNQTIYVKKLMVEEGRNNNPIWYPHIEDLKGTDGNDATIYSATPPSDTTKLWHSSTDNEIRYYNRELSEWIGLDKKALDTIEGLRLDVSSEIKNTGDSILQTVQESYYSIAQTDELIRQQESTIESTSDKISLAISILQKIVDENKNLTDDEFQFIKTYFDFKDDGLLIGKSNSTLTVELKNDRLSFNDNGREVAYMSNNKLYVYDGEFMNSLKIGKFQWIPRESGNLSFVRVK